MPTFIVKSPKGETFEVNGPEGGTQEDAISYVQSNYDRLLKEQGPKQESHLSFGENLAVAAGDAVGNIANVAASGINKFILDDENKKKVVESRAAWLREKTKEALGAGEDKIRGKTSNFGGKLTQGAAGIAGTFLQGGPLPGAIMQGTGGGMEEYNNLIAQGVPRKEAMKVAWATGLSTAAGLAIPGMGGAVKTTGQLAARAGAAGGINAVQGGLTDAYKQHVLDPVAPEIAKKYNPFDIENRGVDFLLPAVVVGGVSKYKSVKDAKRQAAADAKFDLLPKALPKDDPKAAPDLSGKPPVGAQQEFNFSDPLMKTAQAGAEARARSQSANTLQGDLFNDNPPPAARSTPIEEVHGRQQMNADSPQGDLFNPALGAPRRPIQEVAPEDMIPSNLGKSARDVDVMDEEGPSSVVPKQPDQGSLNFGPEDIYKILDTLNQEPGRIDTEGPQPVTPNTQRAEPGTLDPANQSRINRTGQGKTHTLSGSRRKQSGAINTKEIIDGVSDLINKLISEGTPAKRAEKAARQDALNKNAPKALAATVELSAPKSLQDAIDQTSLTKDINTGVVAKVSDKIGSTDQFVSGARAKGAITNSPLVRYFNKKIVDATAATGMFLRQHVEPWAAIWNKMTPQDQTDLRTLMVKGDRHRTEYTPEQLKAAGYSDSVIHFLGKFRPSTDKFLELENATRAQFGDDPIERRTGYSPTSFRGDFTALVRDAEGKVLSVLRTKSTGEMKRAIQASKALFPDGIITETVAKGRFDIPQREYVAAMKDIYKILGNDPRMADMIKALEAKGYDEGKSLYGFDVHELNKMGVRGGEGDKYWKTAEENNKDFFKSLVGYFEEGTTTQGMRSAFSELKGLNANEYLTKNHPNTLKYLNNLKKDVSGDNVNAVGKGLNSVLDYGANIFGYGPSAKVAINANVQNLFHHVFLGSVNLRMFMAQMMQIGQTGLPALYTLSKTTGAPLGTVLRAYGSATVHMTAYTLLKNLNGDLSGFSPEMLTAIKYAEDRGLTSFSKYDQIHQYGDSGKKSTVENISNVGLRWSEASTRPTQFLAAFKALREAGMPVPDALERAENSTQLAMIDYHQNQKPTVYKHFGEVGKQAGQFKTFLHGNVSQLRYLASKGPEFLGVALLMQFMVAGTQGMIGWNIVEALWDSMTEGRSATDDVKQTAKQWMGDHLADMIVYGAASKLSGLYLQPSLSSENIVPLDKRELTRFLFPSAGPLAAMGKEAYNFARGEDKTQAAKNFGKEIAPGSARGLYDSIFNTDDNRRLLDRQGRPSYEISEKEENVRKFGLGLTTTSQGVKSDQIYRNRDKIRKEEEQQKELAASLTKRLVSGEYTRDQLIDDLVKYNKLGGEGAASKLIQRLPQEMIKKLLTPEELLMLKGTEQSLTKASKMMKGVPDGQTAP